MNSQMIVHHPYRSLTSLQGNFSLAQEESNLAWSIINDHYMTDLPLLYAPHIIALTAILLALVLRPVTGGATGGNISSSIPTSSANNVAMAAAAALNQASHALNSGGQLRTAPAMEKPGGPVRTKIQKLSSWLAESNIDIEGMVDCTQEIISFYDVQEQYNEKLTREQINRYVKARNLDK